MKRKTIAALTSFALAAAAWGAMAADDAASATAVAKIIDRQGKPVGTATFKSADGGTVINLDIDGLAAGPKAIHLHAVGTCDDASAGFKASGGHLLSDKHQHGFLNQEGPDAGDLPNFKVSETGIAWAEMYTTRATLMDGDSGATILDDDGTAIVIHTSPDDYRTQPIGGAGDRIACGVVKPH